MHVSREIRIVIGTSASPKGLGGDARVAFELSQALSQSNPVLLVCSNVFKRVTYLPASEAFPHLSFLYVPGNEHRPYIATYPRFSPSILKSVWRALDTFNPDVVHIHDQGPIPLMLMLWARKRKVPLVFTCHTLPSRIFDFGVRSLSPLTVWFLDNPLFKRFYLDPFLYKASAIIALNESIEKDLATYDLDTKKIYSIPNGRFLDRFYTLDMPEITDAKVRLVYIGVLAERKNQKFLVEVMEHLPRDKFVLDLVGAPLELDYAKTLEAYASSKHLPVNFVGPVSPEKIPYYLERAHFFVSASKMEVQSLAVIEALASGTPVVALPNETTLDLVDSSVGYVFQESAEVSPSKFADKLLELSNLSEDAYMRIFRNARNRVSHLDWTSISQQTLDVYRDLL